MGCCNGIHRKLGSAARAVGDGASGLARAALGIESPSRAAIAGRALQCFGAVGQSAPCERLGAGLLCMECGCLAIAKVRVASQECPLGKWGAVRPKSVSPGAFGQRPRATARPPDM